MQEFHPELLDFCRKFVHRVFVHRFLCSLCSLVGQRVVFSSREVFPPFEFFSFQSHDSLHRDREDEATKNHVVTITVLRVQLGCLVERFRDVLLPRVLQPVLTRRLRRSSVSRAALLLRYRSCSIIYRVTTLFCNASMLPQLP